MSAQQIRKFTGISTCLLSFLTLAAYFAFDYRYLKIAAWASSSDSGSYAHMCEWFSKAGGKDLEAWIWSEMKESVVLPQKGPMGEKLVWVLGANIQESKRETVWGLEKHDWIENKKDFS